MAVIVIQGRRPPSGTSGIAIDDIFIARCSEFGMRLWFTYLYTLIDLV